MRLLKTLWDGVRAFALQRPRANPVEIGPDTFASMLVIYLGVAFVLAMIDAPRPWVFVPYGLTTALTDAMLTIAAAWIVMRVMQRDGILWGVASILLAATIVASFVVQVPVGWADVALARDGHDIAAWFLRLVSTWWCLLVIFVLARGLARRQLGYAAVAGILGYAVSGAVWWWLPALPLLTTAKEAAPPIATTAPQETS